MLYDVVIIGAGPAGLFAANRLSETKLKVLVIDKGRDIEHRKCPKDKNPNCVCNCNPCNIYSGMGGAGGKSDGKLGFHPKIGGDLTLYTSKAYEYINIVDKKFTKLSGETKYVIQEEEAKKLQYKALQHGLEFMYFQQKHMGSDRLFHVMQKFKDDLTSKGIEMRMLTHMDDIIVENNQVKAIVVTNNGKQEEILTRSVLCCLGREGSAKVQDMLNKKGNFMSNIEFEHLPIDIGVRVETLNEITEPITNIQYDPKIRMYHLGALIRNFCTNPQGFVVTENYGDYYLVNGHAEHKHKSINCNFAVLYRVSLTEPITNSTAYAMNIAKSFNTLGCKKPIVQKLGDLKNHKRSKQKRIKRAYLEPTLLQAVPGDISLAMPGKILTGILEYIKRLNLLMPGIYEDNNTLLYAPEIKFQSLKPIINAKFESINVKNLFFAGDGGGVSGGIVPAAVTGILAAEGIMKKITKKEQV